MAPVSPHPHDPILPTLRRLQADLSNGGHLSGEFRRQLLSLSVEDRHRVVLCEPSALRRCQTLSDAEFLIDECAATILNRGDDCALCDAFQNCDTDRISMYIEYLVGKRERKRPLDRQPMFAMLDILATHLVNCTLWQPFFGQPPKIADLVFSSGVRPNDNVNGSTLLEFVVYYNRRSYDDGWVKYLLDKGATLCPCSRNGQGAMRLAALCATRDSFEILQRHPSVSQSCRTEGTLLRAAFDLVQVIATCPEMDIETLKGQFEAKTLNGSPSLRAAPYRADTNERLKLVLSAASFVESLFGGYMPSFFVRHLVRQSSRCLSEASGTTSDIVDLLMFIVDSVDDYICDSAMLLLSDIFRHNNNLELGHLSQLLVKFCQRQLRCGGKLKPPEDWALVTRRLLRCALHHTRSVADASRGLGSALQRTAVLTLALHLWYTELNWTETRGLGELIERLVAQGTFVGLSEILLFNECWFPLEEPLDHVDEAKKRIITLVRQAACCQLDNDGGARTRMRPLMCLAARQLNRSVNSDQCHRLPNVLISIRARLIPLPYFVLGHSDGRLRRELDEQKKMAAGSTCFGMRSNSLMGRPWEYFVRQAGHGQ